MYNIVNAVFSFISGLSGNFKEETKHMRKCFGKKMLSVAMAATLLVGSTTALTACGGSSAGKGPVTLTVYSQLANYQGNQIGWSADILQKKFNVKINIIPESSGTFQTRMESGDLGDIVCWGNEDNYKQAVKQGLLYDWEKGGLLDKFGKYIKDHCQDAMAWNKQLTSQYTNGKSKALYGIGHDIATSSKDHDSFFYTWDTRWDLYKKMGYPKVKDMADMATLLKNMQKRQPKDENGNRTYAVSLWPDWDGDMVMYVKSTATAYYGYDELGIGIYDPSNGNYHDALQKNGPYLEMLKWYHDLYSAGLVDPDSMTQKYDQMAEKVKSGGVLFSIFNYSGQLQYNTPSHLKQNKYMYSLKPDEAKPIVYGMNTSGGNRIWSIGAKSKYPDLALEVINYLATPEGMMTMNYGPKGETWDYNSKKQPYFTKHGLECNKDKNTTMGGGHKGSYHDGELQINNTIWSIDADNPETDGETYNSANWTTQLAKVQYKIQQDWIDKTGCRTADEYFEKDGNYMLMPAINYTASTKDETFKTTWKQVTNAIVKGSWNAMYADSDAEYNKIVANTIKSANSYGYDECLKWSQKEADKKTKLISELKN